MMHECAQVARSSRNSELLELTDQVLELFDLWEKYLNFRKEAIAGQRS